MRIGFTGSRAGMTGWQQEVLENTLLSADEYLHGDCVGADTIFHEMVREMYPAAHIVAFPVDSPFRAGTSADEIRMRTAHIARNREIVDLADLIIACPNTRKELLRSGTWATIRYARKVGRELRVIFPDGTVGK